MDEGGKGEESGKRRGGGEEKGEERNGKR